MPRLPENLIFPPESHNGMKRGSFIRRNFTKKCASGKQLKKMNRKKAPFIFPYPKYLNPYKKKGCAMYIAKKSTPQGIFVMQKKWQAIKYNS